MSSNNIHPLAARLINYLSGTIPISWYAYNYEGRQNIE